MRVQLPRILSLIQTRALVVSMALLVVIVIIRCYIWRSRTDSIVALRFRFVLPAVRAIFIARSQPRAHALFLGNGQLACPGGSLGHALGLVLLHELVNYLDEAFLVQLAVAGVQDDVDAPLVDGRDQVLELIVIVTELSQMTIEPHLAPLRPHYVRLVEV